MEKINDDFEYHKYLKTHSFKSNIYKNTFFINFYLNIQMTF